MARFLENLPVSACECTFTGSLDTECISVKTLVAETAVWARSRTARLRRKFPPLDVNNRGRVPRSLYWSVGTVICGYNLDNHAGLYE